MSVRVTGTVVDGLLMLDERLSLPNQSRVSVTLEPLAGDLSACQGDVERLIDSFAKYSRRVGPRTWKREDLYDPTGTR